MDTTGYSHWLHCIRIPGKIVKAGRGDAVINGYSGLSELRGSPDAVVESDSA